jgi:hypothetical protein
LARKMFVAATLLTATAIGVIGYQIAYCSLMGNWPDVPVRVVSQALFGTGFNAGWVGGLPVSATLFALAYLAYLMSDQLRLR